MNSTISTTVEYDDTISVEPKRSINGSAASAYPALTERQRTRIVDGLRDRYSDVAVDSVLGAFWDWKLTSYANHASTHERLFRCTLGVQSSERNGALVRRSPRGEEGSVATELHALTRSFVEHHFSKPVTVYRGLDVTVPQLVSELLDHPQKERYDIENPPVFVNFTTDEIIARSYGFLVISADIERDAIGLAPDFVLPYLRNGVVRKRDAELRVRGDMLPAIQKDRIVLPSTGRAVIDAFRAPKTLRDSEHTDVFDLVLQVDTRGDGDEVTTRRGKRSLRRWLRAYRKHVGADGRYRVRKAKTAIERITE